ncbi:MAG: hypothetical protein IJU13_00395 [Bacteroidales bacterium]|nr:hypothetical protein [Bacteroidales bacterium]
MKKQFLLISLLLMGCLSLAAQRVGEVEGVADSFDQYNETLKALTKDLDRAKDVAGLDKFDESLADFNRRWDLYYQAKSGLIGGNKDLLEACTVFLADKENLGKAAVDKRAAVEGKANFAEAASFIAQKDTVYRRYLKAAKRYSQISATAKQLAKIKAKEAILTGKLDAHYAAAIAGAQANPELKIDELQEKYLELKNYSAQIQACEYKPFIQRIKDWLMSFAAIAMILMFANMVWSKYQAYKQMRENMKKMQKEMHKNDDEIPSI